MANRLVRTNQIAAQVGTSYAAVLKWIHEGKIPAERLGYCWYLDPKNVREALLYENRDKRYSNPIVGDSSKTISNSPLGITALSEALGVSRDSINRWRGRGLIQVISGGRYRKYDERAVRIALQTAQTGRIRNRAPLEGTGCDGLLTMRQLAHQLGSNSFTLNRYARHGLIPYIKNHPGMPYNTKRAYNLEEVKIALTKLPDKYNPARYI